MGSESERVSIDRDKDTYQKEQNNCKTKSCDKGEYLQGICLDRKETRQAGLFVYEVCLVLLKPFLFFVSIGLEALHELQWRPDHLIGNGQRSERRLNFL